VDQHGAFVRLAFDLPRGGYATEVLAEIFEASVVSES
jgi:tRNA(Glu) U13 pseudouridine synthase TruD